jgi:hypothetical protein
MRMRTSSKYSSVYKTICIILLYYTKYAFVNIVDLSQFTAIINKTIVSETYIVEGTYAEEKITSRWGYNRIKLEGKKLSSTVDYKKKKKKP